MYKYQCSKIECGSKWALNEGNLNGFVLTCPVCGKGRGLFLAQVKAERKETDEEIIITIDSGSKMSLEELKAKVEAFVEKFSVSVISNTIETAGNEMICKLQYRLKT